MIFFVDYKNPTLARLIHKTCRYENEHVDRGPPSEQPGYEPTEVSQTGKTNYTKKKLKRDFLRAYINALRKINCIFNHFECNYC